MYYLYDNQNPHAPLRSNGKRGWYYPQRSSKIRLLVVHTPEVLPDYVGVDSSAENVAKYFSNVDRAASAHVCIDRDSIVKCLPDEAVAFHVRNYNSISLGAEIGHAHNRWGENADSDEVILQRAGAWFAEKAKLYGIPSIRLTKAQVDAGHAGFAAHSDLDPTRRSDPGASFNWGKLLAYTALTKESDDEMSLKRGDNSPAVGHYQEALIGWNKDALPKYKADKDFGGETEEWVKLFQKAMGLPQTGIIDGVTADLLGRHHPSLGGGVPGPRGPVGPKGDTGPRGPKGDKGDTGDYTVVIEGRVV